MAQNDQTKTPERPDPAATRAGPHSQSELRAAEAEPATDPRAGVTKTSAAQPTANAAVLPPGGEANAGADARAGGAKRGRPLLIGLAVLAVILLLILLI